MFTIEKTIVINRPQKEVFKFASNPANTQKWQGVVKSKNWIFWQLVPPGTGFFMNGTLVSIRRG